MKNDRNLRIDFMEDEGITNLTLFSKLYKKNLNMYELFVCKVIFVSKLWLFITNS